MTFTPVADGSIFFKVPEPSKHTFYVSLDAGYNNPTAILFHGVSKDNGVVTTFAEHYKREMTVQQHAEAVLCYEKWLLEHYGIIPYLRIADPAIKQRQQSTGVSLQIEYSLNGVNWATGQERDINAGLDKMINYLRLRKWYICDNCTSLIREMKGYKRGDYASSKTRATNNLKETPVKKNDHAIDSCRYFFSFQPDLNVKTEKVNQHRPNLLDAPTINIDKFLMYDTNLTAQTEPQFVQDEYVGEW